MRIPDDILECVVFIAFWNHCAPPGKEYDVRGSAFLYGTRSPEAGRLHPYLVTAAHVIQEMAKKGIAVTFVRVPMESGEFRWQPIPTDSWKCHPARSRNVDVAITAFPIPVGNAIRAIAPSMVASAEILKQVDIGIGDDVFVAGFFRPSGSEPRSVPIVRVGTIAGMDEEPVETAAFGKIAAYLIEVRSIGGISGSPVFVRRLFHDRFYLLGLIHGHFDSREERPDMVTEDSVDGVGINTGIAIVVPAYEMIEVMEQFLDTERDYARQHASKEFVREQMVKLAIIATDNPLGQNADSTLKGATLHFDFSVREQTPTPSPIPI